MDIRFVDESQETPAQELKVQMI